MYFIRIIPFPVSPNGERPEQAPSPGGSPVLIAIGAVGRDGGKNKFSN